MKWFAHRTGTGEFQRYFSLAMNDDEFFNMNGLQVIHAVHNKLVEHLTAQWLEEHGATVLEGLEPGVVTEAVSQLVRKRVADKVLA